MFGVRRRSSFAASRVFLECGGGERLEREVEDVAVGAEAFEGPGEVGLRWDAQGTAGSDDAEQDAGSMRAFGAAGKNMLSIRSTTPFLKEVLADAIVAG